MLGIWTLGARSRLGCDDDGAGCLFFSFEDDRGPEDTGGFVSWKGARGTNPAEPSLGHTPLTTAFFILNLLVVLPIAT